MLLRLCAGPDCSHPLDGDADAVLCGSCLGALRARLREIPEAMGELLITVTRQDVAGRGPAGRSSEPPLIYRPDAADAGRDLHAVLVHLTDAVLDHRGLTWTDIDPRRGAGIATYGPPAGSSTTTRSARFPDTNTLELAMWLDRHPESLRDHPDAGTLADELADAVARVWYAVDRPDATRRFLGRCDTCTPVSLATLGLGEWAAELWAREDAAVVRCRSCGTAYDVAARRTAMLKRAENLLVTAEQITRALPLLIVARVELTPDVIRGWVRDHGLRRYPASAGDPHRRALYRLGDLLDQIGAARARAAARARPPVQRLAAISSGVATLFEQARREAARPDEDPSAN